MGREGHVMLRAAHIGETQIDEFNAFVLDELENLVGGHAGIASVGLRTGGLWQGLCHCSKDFYINGLEKNGRDMAPPFARRTCANGVICTKLVMFVGAAASVPAARQPPDTPAGFITISQKIATTLRKAGQPSQNHQRMAR
jgi:hypothetical protein